MKMDMINRLVDWRKKKRKGRQRKNFKYGENEIKNGNDTQIRG